jgi:hypothetical protein
MAPKPETIPTTTDNRENTGALRLLGVRAEGRGGITRSDSRASLYRILPKTRCGEILFGSCQALGVEPELDVCGPKNWPRQTSLAECGTERWRLQTWLGTPANTKVKVHEQISATTEISSLIYWLEIFFAAGIATFGLVESSRR